MPFGTLGVGDPIVEDYKGKQGKLHRWLRRLCRGLISITQQLVAKFHNIRSTKLAERGPVLRPW
jgi:hypothetical protein